MVPRPGQPMPHPLLTRISCVCSPSVCPEGLCLSSEDGVIIKYGSNIPGRILGNYSCTRPNRKIGQWDFVESPTVELILSWNDTIQDEWATLVRYNEIWPGLVSHSRVSFINLVFIHRHSVCDDEDDLPPGEDRGTFHFRSSLYVHLSRCWLSP